MTSENNLQQDLIMYPFYQIAIAGIDYNFACFSIYMPRHRSNFQHQYSSYVSISTCCYTLPSFFHIHNYRKR